MAAVKSAQTLLDHMNALAMLDTGSLLTNMVVWVYIIQTLQHFVLNPLVSSIFAHFRDTLL